MHLPGNIYTDDEEMKMENRTNVMRFQRPPPPPSQRRYFLPSRMLTNLIDLRSKNPELFQSEIAKLKKKAANRKPERIIEDPETRKNRLLAERKIACPFRVLTQPQTIRDTSEATCYTKSEANVYKNLANIDPRLQVFEVLNPKTGEVDEEYTACVIKRFREDRLDSSVTAMATSGTSVFKRHREETGESSLTSSRGVMDDKLVNKSLENRGC